MAKHWSRLGPRQDRAELEPWAMLFRRLTCTRGTLARLAEREASHHATSLPERDVGTILARYSAYRSGTQRPQPDSAFLIGELACELEPPYRTPWSSGLLTLYAAGYLEHYVLLMAVLLEHLPIRRFQQILDCALETVIAFETNIPDPDLIPYLEMRTLPSKRETARFHDAFADVDEERFLMLRRYYRDDVRSRKLLTFDNSVHCAIRLGYELINHDGISVSNSSSLDLALDIAYTRELPLIKRKQHIEIHLNKFSVESVPRASGPVCPLNTDATRQPTEECCHALAHSDGPIIRAPFRSDFRQKLNRSNSRFDEILADTLISRIPLSVVKRARGKLCSLRCETTL